MRKPQWHCWAFAAVCLASCSPDSASDPTLRLAVDAAPAITQPTDTVVEPEAPLLSPSAEAKIEQIRTILARNSLSRLVRLADSEPSFVSNFSGQSHRVHWDLLRRTGFDPLAQLEQLLDGPYAVRTVGEQAWYIWPDLAALEPEALKPERLSFADRARLQALIGDAGLESIRQGQAYPGIRTAIAEDGRWLYFVHEREDELIGEGQDNG
ncbi:MAG: hypothetical protein AAGF20_07915 [Pseudomonadota bacterium]